MPTKAVASLATKVRCAKIIQRFYRKYVKAQRDPLTHYPLDPISREGIVPAQRIRILMEGGGGNIQYFDLETLHQWFKTCMQPLNPLTNTNFTVSQLGCILRVYQNNKKMPPIFIITPSAGTAWVTTAAETFAATAYPYPKPKPKAKAKPKPKPKANSKAAAAAATAAAIDDVPPLEHRILLAAAMESNLEAIREVLYDNVTDIQEGYINLNYKIPLMHTHPTVGTVAASSFVVRWPLEVLVTPLGCAVFYDNVAVVKELLYFNLDINAGHIGAADIALLSTQPNSLEILRWLLYYGGQLSDYGRHCLDYVKDTQKLELISNF
jgi:hypothetical protein